MSKIHEIFLGKHEIILTTAEIDRVALKMLESLLAA